MDPWLLNAARRAIGFMPDDEGLALHEAAQEGAELGPLVEIGSYCGKSTLYLGAAARERDTVVYSIDHHRGSEEHQPGEEYHDPALVDADGNVDTFATFRKTIEQADLWDVVVAIVADSKVAAKGWATPLGMVFIDGGHSLDAALSDLEGWSSHVVAGGFLAIHDVFEDPNEGGRPPFEIYTRAKGSGRFEDHSERGSLRVLKRVAG